MQTEQRTHGGLTPAFGWSMAVLEDMGEAGKLADSLLQLAGVSPVCNGSSQAWAPKGWSKPPSRSEPFYILPVKQEVMQAA